MKRVMLIMLVAFMLVFFAACSDTPADTVGGEEGANEVTEPEGDSAGEEASEEANGGELTPVTLVLDWTPNTNHSGAYVAQALGYFEEQGLDVEIIEPGDNLALQLVAAGQADFGYSYQEEVTYGRVAGMPVVSLAAVIQHNTSCFAAPVENGVATVADFSGKTYGSWGGEVEEALLDYLVEQEGGEPATKINIGSSDFFAATQDGGIDFSWVYYATTGIEAELRGVELDTIFLKDIDSTFDYYTPVIVASEDFLAENGDLTGRFMTALSQGYCYCDANPAEAAEILLAANEGLDAELIQAGQEWIAGQYQAEAPYWGYQDAEIWNSFSQWLIDRGLIEDGFVAEDAFTNDYLPQGE